MCAGEGVFPPRAVLGGRLRLAPEPPSARSLRFLRPLVINRFEQNCAAFANLSLQ